MKRWHWMRMLPSALRALSPEAHRSLESFIDKLAGVSSSNQTPALLVWREKMTYVNKYVWALYCSIVYTKLRGKPSEQQQGVDWLPLQEPGSAFSLRMYWVPVHSPPCNKKWGFIFWYLSWYHYYYHISMSTNLPTTDTLGLTIIIKQQATTLSCLVSSFYQENFRVNSWFPKGNLYHLLTSLMEIL